MLAHTHTLEPVLSRLATDVAQTQRARAGFGVAAAAAASAAERGSRGGGGGGGLEPQEGSYE